MQAGDSTGGERVTLPASLGIEDAGALHAQLAVLLDPPRVTLDGAIVARLHTATLQVLAAFVRTRAQAGRETAWHAPSAALTAAAARLGIERLLGLNPVSATGSTP